MHVLGELAQEGGEGGRLLHDDALLHSLHRGGWKADASSPGGGDRKGSLELMGCVLLHPPMMGDSADRLAVYRL